jgi:WD40 repeat protein
MLKNRVAWAAGMLSLLTAAANTGPPEAEDRPKPLLTLRGHTKAVTCVEFSPDGKLLASGSGGGTIKLWATAMGKPAEK